MAKGESGRGVVLGYLKYVLGFDSLAFEDGVGDAEKRMKKAQKSLAKTAEGFTNLGATLTVGVSAPLVAAAAAAVNGAQAQAAAVAQVDAAIRSMGNAAGLSSGELSKFADQLELKSLFDADEILKKSTANLLTFGNIAGDVFKAAQQAAVDMATRMEGDLQGATIMIGKALNDPVNGLGALSKNGALTKEWIAGNKDRIAAMVAEGKIAQVQTEIIGQLNKQFVDSAAAAAKADPMREVMVKLGQAGDAIGEKLLPLIPPVTTAIVGLLDAFTSLSPEMQTFAVGAAAVAAAVGPILMAVGGMISGFSALLPLLGGAGLAGAMGTIGAVALPVVAGLAAAWVLFGDKIGPVLSDFAEKVQAVLGPKLMELVDTVRAGLTSLWEGPLDAAIRVVIDVLGDLGAAFLSIVGDGLVRVLSGAVTLVGGAFEAIVNAIKVVVAVLTGDFAGAWEATKALLGGVVSTVLAVFDSMAPGAINAMKMMYEGIKLWIMDRLNAVWDALTGKIKAAANMFKWLWDVVVGHSYIPDLVDDIGAEIARLDGNMVKPIVSMTEAAAESFRKLQSDVAGILARLFPTAAAITDVEAQLQRLDEAMAAKLVSPQVWAAARDRLDRELRALRDRAAEEASAELGLPDMEQSRAALNEMVADLWDKLPSLEAANDNFAQSFEEMSQRILGAVDNLVGAIRGGDFFDVLDGIIGVFGSLSSAGIFGKNMQSLFGGGGGFGGFRAMGGPVAAGKSYIVGENGPEWFTPKSAGYVTPNGGGGRVGPAITFDMRGAVVTQDLLAQMNAIAAGQAAQVVGRAGARAAKRSARRTG